MTPAHLNHLAYYMPISNICSCDCVSIKLMALHGRICGRELGNWKIMVNETVIIMTVPTSVIPESATDSLH